MRFGEAEPCNPVYLALCSEPAGATRAFQSKHAAAQLIRIDVAPDRPCVYDVATALAMLTEGKCGALAARAGFFLVFTACGGEEIFPFSAFAFQC